MSHLEGGTIAALRDGELAVEDVVEHLDACPRCDTALSEARARAAAVSEALRALDRPVDVTSAKDAVRARLEAERGEARSPRRPWRRALGRAAALLLVAAGGAYAIPGSPVRVWLGGAPDPIPSGGRTTAATQEAAPGGGIEVEVRNGRIEVALDSVPPGAEVELVWVDGATARISAPAGSSFTFGEGRAEAMVESGPVRVELPRFATVVSVLVDGATYVRRTSGVLEVLEPVAERTDDRIRFVVRER